MYNLPLACMGKVTGEKIGSYVGLVEELDVYDGDTGWGEYLRAKIVIDMTKPLVRGRMLHIQGQSTWVAFRYEKLSKFCFDCGIIKHDHQGCHKSGNKLKARADEAQQYGPWLRFQYPTTRGMGRENRYGRNRFDGDLNGGQNYKFSGNRNEETWKPSSMNNEHGSDDDGGFSENPSSIMVAAGMESDKYRKVGFTAHDLMMTEDREPGDTMIGKKRKVWVAKEGKLAIPKTPVGNPIITKEALGESTEGQKRKELGSKEGNAEEEESRAEGVPREFGRINSGPKQKFLGQWNSALGRMTYVPLEDDSSDALLAKDPTTNTYHPRVELGRKISNIVSALVSREESWVPPGEWATTPDADSPPILHTDHSRDHSGSVTTWKKRAHRVGAPQEKHDSDGTMAGKRKVVMGTEVEVAKQKKKGKKSGSISYQQQTEQAEAAPAPPNPMNVLSWNCRGLGNPRTVRTLHRLVRVKKPNSVFLMETNQLGRKVESVRIKLGFDGLLWWIA